jgi:hypothetical protein
VADYPPEPWDLRGQLHLSTFLVPLSEIPFTAPPGYQAVRLGRFGLVGIAWVSYEPSGVLAYRELMSTLLVRRGPRLMPTVTHIWVDSEASRDGGRELWGIPKEMAKFGTGASDFSAVEDDGPIATGTVRTRAALPGRWPIRFRQVQSFPVAEPRTARVTAVRARAGISLDAATFDADPTGPLAFLVGRRPLLSLSMRDFTMFFGGR